MKCPSCVGVIYGVLLASFDHRNFISCIFMHMCPLKMHVKYSGAWIIRTKICENLCELTRHATHRGYHSWQVVFRYEIRPISYEILWHTWLASPLHSLKNQEKVKNLSWNQLILNFSGGFHMKSTWSLEIPLISLNLQMKSVKSTWFHEIANEIHLISWNCETDLISWNPQMKSVKSTRNSTFPRKMSFRALAKYRFFI